MDIVNLINKFWMALKVKKWLLLINIIIIVVFLCFYQSKGNISIKITLLIILCSCLAILFSSARIHISAIITILLMGFLFSLITPIFDVPDEQAHFARAMYLSEGNITISNAGSDLLISNDYNKIYQNMGKNLFQNNLSDEYSSKQMISAPAIKATAVYSMISYIPQAIGIFLGRLLNLNLEITFYLGRFINLLGYALLIGLAIKITPIFKMPIYFFATIPMAIYIASSYNQDALTISLAILIICTYLKFLFSKNLGIKNLVLFMLLCFIMAMTKLPYVFLSILLLFIPKKNFKNRKESFYTYLMMIVILCFSFFWYKYTGRITADHIPENVNAYKQISFIIQNIPQSIHYLGNSLMNFSNYWKMGFMYGWFTYSAVEIAILYTFLMGAICIFYPREFEQKNISRLSAGFVILFIYIGICLTMYLTWTQLGMPQIEGVQGRYFLGVLPLLPLLLNIGILPKDGEELYRKIKNKYDSIFSTIPIFFLVAIVILTTNFYY